MLHRSELVRLARLALLSTFLTPLPALAQAVAPAPARAAAAEDSVDDAAIVVTGSRFSAASYTAPTELPAVGASASPNNTSGAGDIVAGVAGLDTVNLCNLGVTRTVVLSDNQRVVQSNVTGQIDVGRIPTTLVQRIDVVTAGASVACGPDAVSGVVGLGSDVAGWFKISLQGNYGKTFSRNNLLPFIRIGAEAPLIRADNRLLFHADVRHRL